MRLLSRAACSTRRGIGSAIPTSTRPVSIRSCTISSGAPVRVAIRIPWFDSSFYLQSNPDVAAAGVNPLVHYLEAGGVHGLAPHPRFDAAFYLASNPEVAAAGINPLRPLSESWSRCRNQAASQGGENRKASEGGEAGERAKAARAKEKAKAARAKESAKAARAEAERGIGAETVAGFRKAHRIRPAARPLAMVQPAQPGRGAAAPQRAPSERPRSRPGDA